MDHSFENCYFKRKCLKMCLAICKMFFVCKIFSVDKEEYPNLDR